MGAYLSEPNLNKDSLDDGNEHIAYGASSMQGWRLEQEDAHNAILDFDPKSNTSFFAVYDGHGGSEVAAYCAKYMPAFLKNLDEYQRNELEQALKTLFLKFDESLLSPEAEKELKDMRDACSNKTSIKEEEEEEEEDLDEELKEEEEQDEGTESEDSSAKNEATTQKVSEPKSGNADEIVSETAQLYDEACMPLEEVLKRYKSTQKKVKKALNKNHLINGQKPGLSPMISAPGSTASRNLRSKKLHELADDKQKTPPPPAKSAAELDQQEELDITEIKKNGHLDGNQNYEQDFDEASNLCDLTDSQKSANGLDSANTTGFNLTSNAGTIEAAAAAASSTNTAPIQEEAAQPSVKSAESSLSAPNLLHLTSTELNLQQTPNTKAKLKLNKDELKLSPIRKKSLSSSSLCEESTHVNEASTVVSAGDRTEALKAEENKENDGMCTNKSENGESDEKALNENGTEPQEIAAAAKKAPGKKQQQATRSNLIAKLIAGCINEKLKQSKKESHENKEDDKASLDDEDDEEDENYSGEEDEDDEEDDEEDEDESSDEDYEEDEDDDDEEEDDEEKSDEDDYLGAAGGVSRPGFDSGCTAVVALLHDNKRLYVANAGDSRCVVCRDGKAVDMSYDHKPEDEAERERVEKAGGQVTKDGRINNGLNLSRAIGDHAYKANKELSLSEQMITSLPDILTLDIDPLKDSFMILACDGIWNFMSSQDVCDYVQERLNANYAKLSQICEELFMHCLAPNSEGDGTGCDNMTCILVTFQPFRKVEMTLKKNSPQTNPVCIEQDKNGLKRTIETVGCTNSSNSTATKKLKQEDNDTTANTATIQSSSSSSSSS